MNACRQALTQSAPCAFLANELDPLKVAPCDLAELGLRVLNVGLQGLSTLQVRSRVFLHGLERLRLMSL